MNETKSIDVVNMVNNYINEEKSQNMKTELIFLGPPACGKGTQTTKLAEYLNFPHVDTGSLLRAEIKAETPAGIEAKKFIDKLPVNERKWVVSAIEQLPNGEDIKKMQGYDELLRLRVGDYRIIYSVDNGELIVYVVDAGNRGDIYKRYK